MNRQPHFFGVFLPYLLISAIVVFTAVMNATTTHATDHKPQATGYLQAVQIAAIEAEAALPVYSAQPANDTAPEPEATGSLPAATESDTAPGHAAANGSLPATTAGTEPGIPVATGDWRINIASLSSANEADEFIARVRVGGFDAVQQPVVVNGRHYWRISVEGFRSQAEAKARAAQIMERLGLGSFWVSKDS